MKRRIILAVIVLAVLGLVAGGIAWYVRQNSGPRLLARAHLAMQAGKYERAIDLAKTYLAKSPERPVRGLYVLGVCYTRLGRFDEAIVPLQKALQETPDDVDLVLAMADTSALRAMRALGPEDVGEQPDALRTASAQLREALGILTPALKKAEEALAPETEPKAADVRNAVDLGYAVGLNEIRLAKAQRRLSGRLGKEAETAELGGAAAAAAAKRRESEEAQTASDAAYREAIQTLLPVVQRDPTHSRAGELLVQLCIERNDAASLEAARRAILALDDPPPVPALMLARREYQADGEELPAPERRAKLSQMAESLDAILAKHPDEPQVMVARADVALALSDRATADRLVAAVLKSDPHNGGARFVRAKGLYQAGKAAEAETELFSLKTEFRTWVDVHYLYARAALATGKKELARDAMRTVTKLDPNHGGARQFLAAALLDEGFQDQAAADVQMLYETLPGNPDALSLYVAWAVRTNQPVEAARAIALGLLSCGMPGKCAKDREKILDKDPSDKWSELLREFAEKVEKLGYGTDPPMVRAAKECAEECKKRLEKDSSDTWTKRLLQFAEKVQKEGYGTDLPMMLAVAEGYAALGRNADARKVLSPLADDSKPKSTADLLAVARGLLLLGRGAEAETMLNKAVAADPESARARYDMGRLYTETGRAMQALEHYRAAVEGAPSQQVYRLALAQALLRCGLLDEAVAECKAIQQQDRSNTQAMLLLSQIQIIRGEPVDAAQVLEKADARAGLPMAMLYLRNGQPDLAVKILEKAPASAEVQSILGQAYLALGQKEKCLEQWKPLLKSRPDDLTNYIRIASVLSADSKPEAVETALQELPGARPPMVDLAMGWLYKRQGRFDVAAEAYKRLLDRPGTPEDLQGRARMLRAEALAHGGQVDQALAELDRLIQAKEWYRYATYAKAQLLASAGRPAEAGAVLKPLEDTARQQKPPDIDLLGRIAEIYVRIKDPDNKALAICDALQDALPEDARSYLLRGSVFAASNRLADSIPCYRKAIELQPANLDTYQMLANVYDAQLDPAGALATLKKLADVGEAPRAISLFEQGALFIRWGLSHKAVACFEELAKMGYAGDPRVKLGLGQAFSRLGEKDRARSQLKGIPRYAAQYVPAQQMLAALADKPEEKLEILRALQETESARGGVLAQQMRILVEDDRPAEAVSLLEPYLTKEPDVGALSWSAAETVLVAMIRAGENQKAADWAVRVAKTAPSGRWAQLSTLMALRTQPGAVKAVLPEVSKAGMTDAVLGFIVALRSGAGADVWRARIQELADAAVQRGMKQPVPPTYDLLMAVASGRAAEAERLAKAFTRWAGISPDAAAELVGAAKGNPAVAAEAASLLAATVAVDMGIPSLGRTWALDLLKARPASQWAASIVLRGEQEPALERQALEVLTPKDCPLARLAQARQLGRDGKYKEAAEVYRKVAADEKDPDLILEQAIATEQAGMMAEALALYRQVWDRLKSPVAANNAAYLVSLLSPDDKDALAEAAKWTAAAVEAAPNVASFLDTQGWIAHLQGRKDEACRILRRAVKGLPESPDVHYHLGLAEVAAGNKDLARWHLQEVATIGDNWKAASKEIPPATAKIIASARQALARLEPPAP